MNTAQKSALLFLRVTLGWIFLYAGISHLTDPGFAKSITGYLSHAQLLGGFFNWLITPSLLPIVAALNAWGLTLLGLALIFGIATRLACWLGAIMMFLYYLPLGILHPNAHSVIVDEHIIYIGALAVLSAFRAGRAFGIDGLLSKRDSYRLG